MFRPRALVRETVSIRAILILPVEVFIMIPCQMLDLSKGGAKVQIKVAFTLPPKLFLLNDESEDLYECETRWQNEDAAGLMFIDACNHSKYKKIMEKCADAVVIEPPTD
jgi:hypothetical protein